MLRGLHVDVGQFLRHVIFVMLGEQAFGDKYAVGAEAAIGDDARSFDKQVRGNTAISTGC